MSAYARKVEKVGETNTFDSKTHTKTFFQMQVHGKPHSERTWLTVGVAGGPWSTTVGMGSGTVNGAIHVQSVVTGRDMGVSIQLQGVVLQAMEHWAIIMGGLWTKGIQLVELTAIGAGEQL